MPQINTDYPQKPVLLEGSYPATLKEVNQYVKTYDGVETDKLAWVFSVIATDDQVDDSVEFEEPNEEAGIYEISAHTSFSSGPRSKLRPLLEGMIGRVPSKLDTDDLLGTEVMVLVESYEKDNGQTANVVSKVKPRKKGKVASKTETATKTEAEKEEEEDFKNLPF